MTRETEPGESPQDERSEGAPQTEDKKDAVQEQSEESFPASDPPSY